MGKRVVVDLFMRGGWMAGKDIPEVEELFPDITDVARIGTASSGFFGHHGRPGKVGGSVAGLGSGEIEQELSVLLDAHKGGGVHGMGWTEKDMNRRNDLIVELRDATLRDYEGLSNGKIGEKNPPPDDHLPDAIKTVQLPWELDKYEQGAPDWAQEARDAYVVKDPRTLANNKALRDGKTLTDAQDRWVSKVDRLVETGTISEDSVVYRGAALSPGFLDTLGKGSDFLSKAFMSVSPEVVFAEKYVDTRCKGDPLAGNQMVLFRLVLPKGTQVGRMDSIEYVLPRGTSFGITGIERPDEPGGFWRIYGTVK